MPIHKQGNMQDPANYGGITVTPIIITVLEHVFDKRHNHILEPTQSRLQKGSTKNTFSINAKARNEAKARKSLAGDNPGYTKGIWCCISPIPSTEALLRCN